MTAVGARGVTGQHAVRHVVVDSELVVASVIHHNLHTAVSSVVAPTYTVQPVIANNVQVNSPFLLILSAAALVFYLILIIYIF